MGCECVQIHRIKVIRSLRRNDSAADLARILDDGKTPSLEVATAPPTTKQKLIKLLTGLEPGQSARGAGPTARAKLVLISAFLALHVLNLCTTLTATTAIHRHSAHSPHPPIPSTKLDPNAPLLSSVLAPLAGKGLLVHLDQPVQLRAFLPGQPVEPFGGGLASPTATESSAASSLALLDAFMSSWTTLVGDPVMSKWIVIALGISVFLNGYLLKGIATGAGSESYAPASAAQEAARILLASTGADLPAQMERERKAKMTRRWSGGVEMARAAAIGGKLPDDATMEDEAAEESPTEEIKKRRSSQSSDDSNASSTLYVRQPPRRRTGTVVRKPQSVSMTPTLHGFGADLPVTQGNTPGTVTPSIALTPTGSSLVSSRQLSQASGDDGTTDASDESLSQLPPRPLDECLEIFNGGEGATALSDEEVILLVQKGKMAAYALEKSLKDLARAVRIRRALICALPIASPSLLIR